MIRKTHTRNLIRNWCAWIAYSLSSSSPMDTPSAFWYHPRPHKTSTSNVSRDKWCMWNSLDLCVDDRQSPTSMYAQSYQWNSKLCDGYSVGLLVRLDGWPMKTGCYVIEWWCVVFMRCSVSEYVIPSFSCFFLFFPVFSWSVLFELVFL